MNDYVTLLGAEQVQRAASSMRQSAQEMQRAANTMQESLEWHVRQLSDLLTRLEQLAEKSDE